MPQYNALADRPSNMLAYPDTMRATPRNEYLGALADLIAQSYSPVRTQQMQGTARFLSMPAISQTLDRLSYGEPLTTGAGGLGVFLPWALLWACSRPAAPWLVAPWLFVGGMPSFRAFAFGFLCRAPCAMVSGQGARCCILSSPPSISSRHAHILKHITHTV
jgi:hypothetical protein